MQSAATLHCCTAMC